MSDPREVGASGGLDQEIVAPWSDRTRSDAVQVAALLDSPEIAELVSELAATRWTGRPGYPIRAMVGMALAKPLYTLPTWTPHRRPGQRARRPPYRPRLR
jgi:hypothetical protein